MSRRFFSLVSMRLTSDRAFEWQVKFNDAFYEMERGLMQTQTNNSDMEWNQTRLIGKTARLEETDQIKLFIEYAIKQGSKSTLFYFKHYTNSTYKALGLLSQNDPKLRDQMNIYQISQLILAEKLAADKIKEYMDLGRHYKDIYTSVKNDLLKFGDIVRGIEGPE